MVMSLVEGKRAGRPLSLLLGCGFVERENGAGEGWEGVVFLVEVGEEPYFVFCWGSGEEEAEGLADFFSPSSSHCRL